MGSGRHLLNGTGRGYSGSGYGSRYDDYDDYYQEEEEEEEETYYEQPQQRSWQQPIPYEGYYEEVGGDRTDGSGKQDIYGGYNYSGSIFQTPDGANQDHSHEVLRNDGSTEYKRDYKGNRIV